MIQTRLCGDGFCTTSDKNVRRRYHTKRPRCRLLLFTQEIQGRKTDDSIRKLFMKTFKSSRSALANSTDDTQRTSRFATANT